MTDRDLLADLIAKLVEMEEQLAIAQLEAREQSLLASRIQHLTILAHYVHARLDKMVQSLDLPPKADPEIPGDSKSRP